VAWALAYGELVNRSVMSKSRAASKKHREVFGKYVVVLFMLCTSDADDTVHL
jgi:hypothetical protein